MPAEPWGVLSLSLPARRRLLSCPAVKSDRKARIHLKTFLWTGSFHSIFSSFRNIFSSLRNIFSFLRNIFSSLRNVPTWDTLPAQLITVIFFQFWTQRQTVLGTGPQATGNRSARPTHLSKFLSFVQLMPGYTCSFFCCGTRKEAQLQGGRGAFIKHLSGSHEQTARWWSPEKTR